MDACSATTHRKIDVDDTPPQSVLNTHAVQ